MSKTATTNAPDAVSAPVQTPAAPARAAAAPAPRSSLVSTRETLNGLLEARREKFSEALPEHMPVERLLLLTRLAAERTPKLFQCTQESVITAVMTAAMLGLWPDGTLGSGYLVPYWNTEKRVLECEFQPGYRGLIDLARRAGAITQMDAVAVFRGEPFKVFRGTDPKIVHEPVYDVSRGEADLVAVYSVAWLVGGGSSFDVMSRQEIDAVRARSSAKKGPWITDFAEMSRKSVVKRHIKYLPLSPERASRLMAAIEHDNRVDYNADPNVSAELDTPESIRQRMFDETQAKADALAAQLKAQSARESEGDCTCADIEMEDGAVPEADTAFRSAHGHYPMCVVTLQAAGEDAARAVRESEARAPAEAV